MLSIIGCGNLTRCDDGVGVFVAQRIHELLKDNLLQGVQVLDAGTGGIDVMFQARGSSALIIVDACTSGSPPGSIFKASGAQLETVQQPSLNLHDFRWDHALHAGRRIFKGEFPEDVTVYLIEAASLDFGVGMCSAVKDAGEQVAEAIWSRLQADAHTSASC